MWNVLHFLWPVCDPELGYYSHWIVMLKEKGELCTQKKRPGENRKNSNKKCSVWILEKISSSSGN